MRLVLLKVNNERIIIKKQITYTSGLLALSICLLTACSNPSKVINASEPSVSSQSSAATPQPAAPDKSNEKDHAAAFLGVWTQDNPPIVEITRAGDAWQVREFYGNQAKDNVGKIFSAELRGNQIVAKGDAKQFYKQELPTFTLLPNGKVKYDCGSGPFEFSKTNQSMPNAPYKAPRQVTNELKAPKTS